MTTTARTGRPPRGGFTLIELLVVIAIMAVLAAVAVGTYFRIQGGQIVKGTEDRIKNINAQLNRQWSATLDTGRKEFDNDVVFSPNTRGCASILTTYCGGDRDRAKSLWLYLRIKNDFPQTFDEARSDVVLRDSGGTTQLTLRAKKTFEKLPNVVPRDANQAALQSAVILHIVAQERAARGEMSSEESVGAAGGTADVESSATGTATTAYPVFKDMWGQPLAYVRFAANSAEINTSPYLKPSTGNNKDPLDPAGKLRGTWTNRTAAAQAIFGQGASDFPTENWLVTVISSGPQGDDGKYTFESVDQGPASTAGLGKVSRLSQTPSDSRNSLIQVLPTTDDILGYRLRREGQGGN